MRRTFLTGTALTGTLGIHQLLHNGFVCVALDAAEIQCCVCPSFARLNLHSGCSAIMKLCKLLPLVTEIVAVMDEVDLVVMNLTQQCRLSSDLIGTNVRSTLYALGCWTYVHVSYTPLRYHECNDSKHWPDVEGADSPKCRIRGLAPGRSGFLGHSAKRVQGPSATAQNDSIGGDELTALRAACRRIAFFSFSFCLLVWQWPASSEA